VAKDKTKRLEVARFQMKMSKFGMLSFLGLSNIAKGFIIPKFLARL
jgi:hypothetical protein